MCSSFLNAARKAGIRVFYALHRGYRPGDYETWKYMAPIQKAAWSHKTFEYGTWGGEIRSEFKPEPGDVMAQEHWCSSGFASTDLDLLGGETVWPQQFRNRSPYRRKISATSSRGLLTSFDRPRRNSESRESEGRPEGWGRFGSGAPRHEDSGP